MEIKKNEIDVINDLIEINNDRVEGFEKAGRHLEEKENSLTVLFNKLAAQSKANTAELTRLVQQYGGEAAHGTSTSGALHRTWLDVKSVFTGGDAEAVLDECERGEDAIKAAYHSALDPENTLSPELVQVLETQLTGIVEGHDLIKSLRDQAKVSEDYEKDEDDSTATNPVYGDETVTHEHSYADKTGETQL